jgi:hypothetical protein
MLAESINWNYITERVTRYNSNPSDDLLYRIGTHVNVLTLEDCSRIASENQQNGALDPEQRYRVLNWILCNGFQVETDLALLIFGRQQLKQWLEISRQAYPDFEFYLAFEYLTRSKSNCEDGICFSLFWMPKDGAPVPDTELDFPWKLSWDSGDMFWGDRPYGTKNDFDFTLAVYPNEESFAKPGWFCEAGDWYTTPTDDEASLMSVAQVLEHFTVSV